MEIKGVVRFYIDDEGAGRIYIPKRTAKFINFENGEQLKITLSQQGTIIIEKL